MAAVPTLVYAGNAVGLGWNTETGSLTFGLDGGETIVVYWAGISNGDQGYTIDSYSGVIPRIGDAFNSSLGSSQTYGGFCAVANAAAGIHTITPPTVAGGDDGMVRVWKVTGMPLTLNVRTGGKTRNANNSQTITVSTILPAQAGDLAFGASTHENSVAINPDTLGYPAGWTSDIQWVDGASNIPTDVSHVAVPSTGTLSGTWTSADTNITDTSAVILVLAALATNMSITVPPVAAAVSAGWFADFSVTVSGATGTPHYQWAVNGVNVGADSATLSYLTDYTESLSTVTVTITDDLGPITSLPVALRVFATVRAPMHRRQRPSFEGGNVDWLSAAMVGEGLFDPTVLAQPSGSTGAALAVTESPDTGAATATAAEAAAGAATEQADSGASAATEAEAAALAVTEAADTLSGAATGAEAAALAVTEGADTAVAAATEAISASLAATEDADAASAVATAAEAVALAITEGVDALTSATTGAEAATLAVTEQTDTASSGATAAEEAALAASEDPDTLLSALAGADAALVATEQDDTASGVATAAESADAAPADDADTVAAQAAQAVAAAAAPTEDGDTALSAVLAASTASTALAEDGDSVAAQADVPPADGDIHAAPVEADDTAVGQMAGGLSAAAAPTEAPDTVASAAGAALTAAAALTEDADTFAGKTIAALLALVDVAEDADTLASGAGGFRGLSAQHAAWLESLARLHGLIDPLAVGPTLRGDGTVVQRIAEASGVVILTTIAAPAGDSGPSALDDEQAGWLEALARLHGLVDPLQVTAAQRGDGTLLQSISVTGATVLVERLQ